MYQTLNYSHPNLEGWFITTMGPCSFNFVLNTRAETAYFIVPGPRVRPLPSPTHFFVFFKFFLSFFFFFLSFRSFFHLLITENVVYFFKNVSEVTESENFFFLYVYRYAHKYYGGPIVFDRSFASTVHSLQPQIHLNHIWRNGSLRPGYPAVLILS